jgi:hypothetical protein
MDTKSIGKHLRLAAILNTPEFAVLTEKQQIFVARYISGGLVFNRYDAADAAAAAYRTPNAAVLGAELLGQKKIKRVLDLHFRRSEFEVLLADLRRLLKRSERRGSNTSSLVPDLQRVLELLERHITRENADVR